ncbi:Ribonuclease P protein component [Ascidiaceihabitans donghaensis]|uniref:Ribonuclease P protein component n=1 Tax=Ascidiaceihabitans donghaensis TaxID=1510460 RepID=A0A2R8BHC4_9RHOB|nr:ribonuclease P protein component [Ascidiaceihabitans donghaensis]SPH22469.1 Ribonuclease P protein component [Ascidiaceihabitans donghaensis]
MTPPEASTSNAEVAADMPAAGSSRLDVLKKRADFLRAARAKHIPTKGFVLQYRARGDDAPMRVGFTCSKKVGNAVARNRAKRRLREIAQAILPHHGKHGTDYVLIGRFERTAQRPFTDLLDDLRRALANTE